MTRRFTCLLATTALAFALVACGGDDSSKASPEPSTAEATATATPKAPATTKPTASDTATTPPTTTKPATDGIPSLFPDDFPFPENLNTTESRDESVTALLSGTTTSTADEFIEFYDSRLPGLGWTLDDTTSSGGSHVFTRDGLWVSIVAGDIPGASDTSFQISLQELG
ncbi:hypothetical protein JGU71_01810 [Antrihabitans sp. YC3-6]|uniref:Uncharacterized protein n=1 Tax=Antrihabitans stalagmiti TaxID=2799499 RepID=A0A934NLU8_9NOCA|nr:hypothetical protein [Antrihabitans stalagmiti]MBJ8337611.1 hypothetical protein [Antrihabitans stalagmiti]